MITIWAKRSSEVLFAVVVTVIVASPASPLVGEIVHQSSARVVITSAVHAYGAKNFITVEFSVGLMVATGVSRVISDGSSIPAPSVQATKAKMANKSE